MPVYPFQVSEQTVEPFLTCLRIQGCNSFFRTLSISSAQTFPLLHRIPKTACFDALLPRPESLSANFTERRLFFH